MDNLLNVKFFNQPEINKREILRYSGCEKDDENISKLIDEMLDESLDKLTYSVCWRRFPVKRNGDYIDLGFTKVKSKSLEINLRECNEIILFAATVGFEIDRLIKRYSKLSPSKSLILQAIGAERVESLCDVFCNELSDKFDCRPRFSPGYGDLPLSMQKDVISALDCTRKIGIVLNENLLMSPSKSVTAIVGIKS